VEKAQPTDLPSNLSDTSRHSHDNSADKAGAPTGTGTGTAVVATAEGKAAGSNLHRIVGEDAMDTEGGGEVGLGTVKDEDGQRGVRGGGGVGPGAGEVRQAQGGRLHMETSCWATAGTATLPRTQMRRRR